MNHLSGKVEETASFLQDRLGSAPEIGIMTGTGLGNMADAMDIDLNLDYADLPHFPAPTVQSHRGRLLAGTLAGHPAMVLQGRFHLYEGYSPIQVTYPVRVLKALGVSTLVVTNAAGGINPNFFPGDLMVITDHINLTGENPLVGPNDPRWGERFPDMARAYAPDLVRAAKQAAQSTGIPLRTGVYVGLKGPSLETPAEIRFLRAIGCDAVGMSTVMEVIAAVHAGMQVLGLSILTNVHDPDHPAPARVDDIIAVAERAAPALGRLVEKVVESISARG
ncbi:MAG: purine-nucleoside phosphorylase [Desulfobacterales bacterium]|nr:purine-nucleoside phosphorylase [Desulfobacterales bacterium]